MKALTQKDQRINWITYSPILQQYTALDYIEKSNKGLKFKQEKRSWSASYDEVILMTCLHSRFDFLFYSQLIDFEFDKIYIAVNLSLKYKLKIFFKSLFYRL